ncbi:MAG: universal stress protein [Candidatus Eiseniibacteriota bacterium]|nr:MAG: universal stress protein [Candidatus Eisenbacteria bacterium]
MFKKIMCPVDLSENSLVALKVAADLARTFGAELLVLHVREEFMTKEEMTMLRVSPEHFLEVEKNIATSSKEIMADELKRTGALDLPHQLLLRQGKPFKEIISTAEELGTELIVITTNGRTGVGEKLLGSTAEHIVRHSRVPVLTIRID